MERILCPIVPHTFSENLVLQALEMARGGARKLTLLGIVDAQSIDQDQELHFEKVKDELTDSLIALAELNKAKPDYINTPIEWVIKVESYTGAILDYVQKNGVQFILAGQEQGKKANTSLESLLNESPVPIFVMPYNRPASLLKRLVYATDYSEADIGTVQKLVGFVMPFRAEIRVLHATSNITKKVKADFEEFKQKLNSFVSYDQLYFSLKEYQGSASEALEAYLSEVHGDFLVMLTHRKGIVGQIFRKSTTSSILQDSKYPILVYK